MKYVAAGPGARSVWGVRNQIAGVLLAAGEGRRLGGPKALVEVAGTRLVDRGVALLRAGGTAPLVVVTGAVDVPLLGVITVHNPDWRYRHGVLAGSGARGAPRRVRGRRGRPGGPASDRPGVVQRLIAAYLDGAGIAVASYDGKLRNPVLLARDDWAGCWRWPPATSAPVPTFSAHPDWVTRGGVRRHRPSRRR